VSGTAPLDLANGGDLSPPKAKHIQRNKIMETLKVTTSTLFIGLFWLTSDVAAYPQQTEEIDIVDDHGTRLNCGRSSIGHPEFQELGGNPPGLSGSTMGLIAPPNTKHFHGDQKLRNDTLDLHENHSLKVAR